MQVGGGVGWRVEGQESGSNLVGVFLQILVYPLKTPPCPDTAQSLEG